MIIKNPKIIRATNKLIEMCAQFEAEVLARSRIAREKANLPASATDIPNYRQLLHTTKFEHFHRCTCDKGKHNDGESGGGLSSKTDKDKCKKHKNKRQSSGDESSNDSSSSSGASSYSSSSESEADNSKAKKSENKETKTVADEEDEGFEDIRSMEMHRKQNHPERLHSDLSFNEPDQVNSTQITCNKS